MSNKKIESPEVTEVPPPSKFKFTVLKSVTLPILKIAVEKTAYVRIDGEIFEGKLLPDDVKAGKEHGANLMNVTELESGEQFQIVVPKVLEAVLTESYDGTPDNTYVGRCFALTKQRMATGKKYHNFTVQEIQVD